MPFRISQHCSVLSAMMSYWIDQFYLWCYKLVQAIVQLSLSFPTHSYFYYIRFGTLNLSFQKIRRELISLINISICFIRLQQVKLNFVSVQSLSLQKRLISYQWQRCMTASESYSHLFVNCRIFSTVTLFQIYNHNIQFSKSFRSWLSV